MSAHTDDGIRVDFLDYRIEALVSHGGMGVVYRAQDVRLKRTVALKLIAPELALDERFQERFSRESELAMSLEHPNVVPIHDAGEVDGRLYLAMRYVDGTDLRARLREEGTLAPRDALAIVKQVADALDAAHARGLVHRDVKPSNVLVDGGGHVYLADFGLTRRLTEPGSQLGDGRSLGTPAYLAPEQIEGGRVDGRADVYSLGCMLYECLTGAAPFSRASRLAMVWAHLEEAPPSASEQNRALPEAIDAVIRKAMAKDPDERYETCAELATAAEEALGLPGPGTSHQRTLVLVAAAVVVSLAALIAALAGRGGDEPAAAAPVVRADSLVRIDPATNAIEAVIDVGEGPQATAAAGRSVWVYNLVDDTVSEIDAATNSVRHTTAVSIEPVDVSVLAGPFFVADAGGAWLVGLAHETNEYRLTRILAGGKGAREIRLSQDAAAAGCTSVGCSAAATAPAVAVDGGAVWVLTTGAPRGQLRRIDPATGAVTRHIRGPVPYAEGMAVTDGAAWIMDADTARLYRVDLRSGGIRMRDLGRVATPPTVGFGSVWICVANPGSSMLRIDPRTFRTTFAINSIPAEEGRFAVGYGALWRHDVPSGDVMRFDPKTGKVSATIRVSPEPPTNRRGVAPTAVATGAGSVWVTVSRY